MIRRSIQMLQYHGRISSMLELGGAAHASNKQEKNIIDTSKNNKVRACILDFDLLIRNTNLNNDTKTNKQKANTNVNNNNNESSSLSKIIPDMDKIKNVASLLNVELASTMKLSKLEKEQDNDDLTGLLGYKDTEQYNKTETTRKTNFDDNSKINMKAPPANDVRSKYASKMRSKLEQGYNPNTTTEDNIARGDAKGLLLARSIIMSNTNNKSSSKWIAGTDTGKLLNYLSSRSMKIALIPQRRKELDKNGDDITYQRMKDLTNQLPNVNFHVLQKSSASSTQEILDTVLSKLNDKAPILINPLNILVVSDKDDILGAAKQKGMFSCRVRLNKSSPRGNVSTNYNKENVADIQDVVDDINGISFNSVLSGR